MSVSVFLLLAIAATVAQGQSDESCKCGGKYANGREVQGCQSGACTAKAADSARCVTIYRQNTIIGYDCLPWPSQGGYCATYDDGSRVCLNAQCNATSSDPQCAPQDDDANWHGIVGVQVNNKLLDFALSVVPYKVNQIVANLSIPDQNFDTAAVTASVTDIKIQQFQCPTITYQLLPPNSIRVIIKGGDFSVHANWAAKKWFLKASGGAGVWSKDHFGLDVALTATITPSPNGTLEVGDRQCHINVPVDLKLSGIMGTFVSMAAELAQKFAGQKIYDKICDVVHEQIKTTVKAKLQQLPTHVPIKHPFGAKYNIRSIAFTETSVKLQVAALATVADDASTAAPTPAPAAY